MEISLFQPEDALTCLGIFDSNVPDYFLPQEKEGFASFLSRLPAPVTDFVARNQFQKVIACGGVKLEPEHHLAKLRWDIVHRSFHRQGIGKTLTQHRLAWIAQNQNIHLVQVGTSQFSVGFYE